METKTQEQVFVEFMTEFKELVPEVSGLRLELVELMVEKSFLQVHMTGFLDGTEKLNEAVLKVLGGQK